MIKRQAGAELPGGRVNGKVAMRIPRGDGIKDVISMTCGQGNADRQNDLCTRLTSSAPCRRQQGWAELSVADSGQGVHSSTVYMCMYAQMHVHKCVCTHVCQHMCTSTR